MFTENLKPSGYCQMKQNWRPSIHITEVWFLKYNDRGNATSETNSAL